MKKSLEGDDIEDIKKKTEELTESFYAISQKLYEQNQGQGTGEGEASNNDDVVDADYEVVDED